MTFIDWFIVALFLGALVLIGYLFSRKNKNIEDYFVGGRAMPGWIVAIAATGTAISAGTFVGSPELGFNTNLTYLLNLLGAIVGGLVVAAWLLPKLYNAKTITVYGFIGDRFGQTAKTSTSVMFLLGQLFTSGSRLFIAAIAISVISSGNLALLEAYRAAGGKEVIHLIFAKPEQIRRVQELGNASVSFKYSDLSAEVDLEIAGVKIDSFKHLVDHMHSLGIRICFRAADTTEDALKMIEYGTDYMPSNVKTTIE